MWNFIKKLFGFEPKADAWVDRPNLRSQVEQEYPSRVVVIKQEPSAPVKTPRKRTKKVAETSAPISGIPSAKVDDGSMSLAAIGLIIMDSASPDVKSNPCADHSFASDPGSSYSSSDCSSSYLSGSDSGSSSDFSSGGNF